MTRSPHLSAPRSLLTICCLGVITASVAACQTAPTSGRIKEDDLQAASGDIDARRNRIKDELTSLADRKNLPADHWSRAWAGTYYVGDRLGMNVNIAVAPKAGIAYTWHGCLGLYDGNHGDIDGTFDDDGDGKPDGLKIKWALNLNDRFNFQSQKYYFVRWAGPPGSPGRFYFVPESQMIKLVNNYNEGGYARDGMYSAPLKYGSAPPVEGVPQLPARWAKMLITVALDARITSVTPVATRNVAGNVDATDARLTLNKGRADGLYLGMEASVGPLAGIGRLTIDKLDEHTAEAAYRAFTTAGKPAILPGIGQVVRMSEGTGKNRDGEQPKAP